MFCVISLLSSYEEFSLVSLLRFRDEFIQGLVGIVIGCSQFLFFQQTTRS